MSPLAIEQSREHASQGAAAWGRRSLWTMLIGAIVISAVIGAIYVAHGYTIRGLGASFAMALPIFMGIPLFVVVGLYFAVVGLLQDGEKQISLIAAVLWLLSSAIAAWVVFA